MQGVEIIQRGEKAKAWMENEWNVHLPEQMIVLEKCKCGRDTGFVWGMKNESGQTRYLQNEDGQEIRKCGACMVEESKHYEAILKAENCKKLRDYEAQKHLENEEKKTKKSSFLPQSEVGF